MALSKRPQPPKVRKPQKPALSTSMDVRTMNALRIVAEQKPANVEAALRLLEEEINRSFSGDPARAHLAFNSAKAEMENIIVRQKANNRLK